MGNIKQYKKKLTAVLNNTKELDQNKLDTDYKTLDNAFNKAYNENIFDLHDILPEQIDRYRLELFNTLTKISGSLSFLAIQILAANSIMEKRGYKKRDFYRNKKCGIAINHLRVPKTIITANKIKNGYELNGTLTWASGYKIFDTLLIGFHYDNKEYEAMAPFKKKKGFHIGTADKTFTGYSLNTVNIKLKNYFVKDEDIVSNRDMGSYTKAKSTSKTVHICLYSLGVCALSHSNDMKLKLTGNKKLKKLKNRFLKSNDVDEMDKLRVKLFLLVQDIITTAMVLNGGKSILLDEPLQRLYRELIMFNSNGLNDSLKNNFRSNFL